MKKLILLFSLFCSAGPIYSQVFWTENFTNGCSSACTGPGYIGPNGTWTQTILGPEGADPNAWFVSCAEQNNGIGACSSGCTGAGNSSMHISAAIGNAFCPNDCGAAYDAGGLCGILACPQTNRRIESPVINCSGKTSISLNYAFIHTGAVGTDFASVWYFNGATWTNLGVVPQSNNAGCGGQGKWTAATVALPASADNNANVKIGFSWQNDDDGAGTDPSIAVDDVTLSVPTTTTPPITFSLTLPSPVCQSNTITATLTSTSTPTSFTWSASSPNVVFSAVNSGTTNITFNASGTFTVTLTACQGTVCGTATSSIQVLPTPTINVTASPTVVCVPGSSTLTATGGPSASSYTWTASQGPAISNTNIAVVSPTANTTYTVLTSVPGCTSGIVVTVPVSSAPSLTLTPNSSICNGQSITLNASGAASYTWAPGATLSSTNGAVVTATPATTTNYTVTGSNGVCTNTAVVTVTVAASVSVSVTPGNTTICLGQSANLVASGGSTYTWTASSGTNPASTASVTVSPTTTTTYTVLTGSGTCTAQAVANVSVAPAFTLNVTPASTTICNGTTVTLNASGASSYSWSPTTALSATTGANVNASPSSDITYTVTGSNGVCSNTAIASVTVNPAASVSVTPASTTICSGQNTSLVASGGSTYTWTASSGTAPAGTASVTASPTITTTYTVITGSGTCTTSAVATVSVSPLFTVTATPATTTICNGGTGVTLTGSGGTSYTWAPNTNLSSTSGTTVNANPTADVNYTVTSVNGACTSTAVATVSVNTVNTSATTSSINYCLGGAPVTLTGSGATTYSWAPGTGLSSTSGTTVSATPSITTTYSVTGTTGSCSSNTVITVTVVPSDSIHVSATSTVVCSGSASPTLTATGVNTYTWLPGGAQTSTIQASSFTTTSYTVTGNSTSGCSGIPAVITVSVAPQISPTITAASYSVCLSKTVAINSNVSGAGLTYTWGPTSAIQGASNTSSIMAQPVSTTTVIYTVTISNGVCTGKDTILLQVFECIPPTASFITLNNDTVCVGGCVTFSSTTTGSQPMTYQWFYESGIGTSTVGVHPEACYPSAGTFSVMMVATNAYGTDTVVQSNYITVFAYPPLVVNGDTSINIGQTATVYASGGTSYLWISDPPNSPVTCPTCSVSVVQPTVTTHYIVIASNSQYCSVRDTVTVTVDINCGDFFMPNAFSPNDDGLNDVINVHGRCIYSFNLQIYDRWGEKVFETSSLTEGWDGTYRGQKMNTGVFVYKVDGVDLLGEPFKMKGNITLMR
jgi:gliding motility-associated-like protein